VQLAQSPEVARDPILQDALVKGLVDAHLLLGQRDEALTLAQSSLGTSKEEALKTVMIAYTKAGQTNQVEQWLSKQLSTLRSNPNEWEQKLYIGSLLQTAIETQQFEWIRQQWSQFSAIDYGSVLQDWQVVNMATAYAQTGQHKKAVHWVQQLPLDNRSVLRIKLLATIALNAHQSGATELLKQNRFDLVLPVVEQITVPNNKTQLLLAIAQRRGELQQVDQALPLLAQAFHVAQTIPGEESEVMCFGADGLTVVDREDDRGSLLGAIALQYAHFKQFDQAFKVGNTLQEKPTREQAIGRIQCITRV